MFITLSVGTPLAAEQPKEQTKTIVQKIKEKFSGINENEKIKFTKKILGKANKHLGRKFFTIFCHELGHAMTAKLLWNQPLDVHLGSYKKNNPYFKLGFITIDGFSPAHGYSHSGAPEKTDPYAKSKLATVLIAGGICGGLGNIAYGKLLDKKATLKELCTHEGTIGQILLNLVIPCIDIDGIEGFDNDAGQIWCKCMGIRPSKHFNTLFKARIISPQIASALIRKKLDLQIEELKYDTLDWLMILIGHYLQTLTA